ncbi:MAG TPA: MFS transporter [Rhizomicrobium sp.]|nr:MFS transporter [Rhizomicrobium sp.]
MAFLSGWTPRERHAVIASYLCWSLDAFDYFVLVFVLTDVAQAFHAGITAVALALTLTLAFRPLGAFVFGRLADRYGRRPVLMVNVALYSLFGFLTAFSPSLITFLAIRSLFGVAMGGVWGIGASLAFETIAREKRGFVSGLMQSGYATGYLAASLVFGFLYAWLGWRGLFMVGILPAFFLIFYIWSQVSEAPGWNQERARASTTFSVLKTHWRLALFAIVMMTAFNFFSHGTQDLYPTFLQKQHHFDHATVSTIAILYNIAAILGGLTVGSLSQRFGRRRASVVTALIAVPVAFLWAFSSTAVLLALGAIMMQFLVQGAWGVVPAHLNEISPEGARGTFPGTVYQLGNLIASVNAVLQTSIAERTGGNYAIALASVAIVSVLVIALFMGLGPQAQDVEMV